MLEFVNTGIVAVLTVVINGSWGVLALNPLDLAGVLFDSGCVGLCGSACVEPAVVQCVVVGEGCSGHR
jgi:hypothetical protein